MVLLLAVKLEMCNNSHLVLILEQIWDLYMYPLMVLVIGSLSNYCLEVRWEHQLVVHCFDHMKISNGIV